MGADLSGGFFGANSIGLLVWEGANLTDAHMSGNFVGSLGPAKGVPLNADQATWNPGTICPDGFVVPTDGVKSGSCWKFERGWPRLVVRSGPLSDADAPGRVRRGSRRAA